MDTIDHIPDQRSGVANENIQEIIDAAVSVGHGLGKGAQQYQTPEWLAKGCAALLPCSQHENAFDPQCAGGNLLAQINTYLRFGIELDNRFNTEDAALACSMERITGNCVTTIETMEELFPDTRFGCIVSNPPFGIRWKLKDETTVDSTQWTWNMIKRKLAEYGSGFLISNANTLERLGIVDDPWVYFYQRFPGGGIWDNCNVELGIVHFRNGGSGQGNGIGRHKKVWTHVPTEYELAALREELNVANSWRPWQFGALRYNWGQLEAIVREESLDKPKFNIYLNKEGMLRTYLSTRAELKLDAGEIQQLARINNCHPLTLTTERETRKLMHRYLTEGVYTIEPAAKKAISDALSEVASLACPIRPVTDFELVAYADEEDNLKCVAADGRGKVALTPGKRYEVRTGTYTFKQVFTRKKVYYDEDTDKTEIEDHECVLSGEDRYIQITDDLSRIHRFMDRPDPKSNWQHHEELIWQLFAKPYVPTVAEVQTELYEKNKNAMRFNEMLAGFTYFPGQLEYYARMGCKDYGLVAAATGTGKTLGALTLVALKSPKRSLIIAPQGTMRSSGEEDEVDYQASQWVTEIERFAPTEPVFQLFSRKDWEDVLHANGGELPPGVYITYPQAYFSNHAFEVIPNTWERGVEEKFCNRYQLPFDKERKTEDCFSRNVGASTKGKGIRCIAEPSLATLIETRHGDCWDMVILDEAHLVCNPDAQITKNLIRLQPKYRFAMTATPIPNIISNIFTLMGWLCVPGWHKGKIRNAAWPYAVDEYGRFNSTFLAEEADMTAAWKARAKGKKGWQNVGKRSSPVISSPARLLKLLKPNLAYISKEHCNPNLQPCEVIDVRVALGKEQAKLYQHWLERRNYLNEYKSVLTIARVQLQRLRGVCASPASLDYTRGMCRSNFNPKMVTILQLIRDCLRRGEQVVVVSARVEQTDAIVSRLAQAGITMARIDSSVKAELHTAEANRFKKGEARVMFMGIRCAQGHSFDQCPNLIVGSLEWSYGTLNQAQGRVWRLTSPKPVKIWVVLHENTVEELLFDRVAVKQDAATLCLHGTRVPRDFKTLDSSEVLAEHIVNYNAGDGEILSESECELQWHELKQQLVIANRPVLAEIVRFGKVA